MSPVLHPPSALVAVALFSLSITSVTAAVGCGGGFNGAGDSGPDGITPMDVVDRDSSSPDVLFNNDVQADHRGVDGGHDGPSPETGPRSEGGMDVTPMDVTVPPDDVIHPDDAIMYDVIVPPFDVIVPPIDVIVPPFDAPPPPPDSTTTCGSLGYVGCVGPGMCCTGADYTCGVDTYEVLCDCPTATCTCTKNGKTLPTVVKYSGCPSCSSMPFASVAAACGIPY